MFLVFVFYCMQIFEFLTLMLLPLRRLGGQQIFIRSTLKFLKYLKKNWKHNPLFSEKRIKYLALKFEVLCIFLYKTFLSKEIIKL